VIRQEKYETAAIKSLPLLNNHNFVLYYFIKGGTIKKNAPCRGAPP
jgi:hypothetical protein